LHPVHVETVAWITEQKNTLSAVFYLGAMLLYLRFDETRGRAWYVLALCLFALALLSKTVTVTLPVALLLAIWWKRGRLSWRRDVVPLLPLFALSLADGLLTIWVERKVIGAEGSEFELSLLQKPLLAGRALWFYVGKLAWPTNLTFIYPRWQLDPAQLWQWFFPAAAVLLLVALWGIRKQFRGPLAAMLFFVGTLAPVLGFLNVYFFRYSFVADHFQYLASLGIIVLVSAGIALGLEKVAPQQRRWSGTACVLLLAVLAGLTWRQSSIYGGDATTLYRDVLQKNPTCWMVQNNLAEMLIRKGEVPEAIELKQNSYPEGYFGLAQAQICQDKPLPGFS
jgi:hypothetical protein